MIDVNKIIVSFNFNLDICKNLCIFFVLIKLKRKIDNLKIDKKKEKQR